MRRKILFLISGLGLGNSTRCSAVIEHLTEMGFLVDVVTSGAGGFFFATDPRLSRMLSCRPLHYGSRNGRLSMLRTAWSAPALGLRVARNSFELSRVLRQGGYQAVVLDSDYSFPKTLFRKRPRIYAINNAALVVEAGRHRRSLPLSTRPQFWVERLDALYHRLVPDLVLVPTLAWNRTDSGKYRFIPPVVRSGISARPRPSRPKRILIMLSGSRLGQDTSFLAKLPPLSVSIDVLGKAPLTTGANPHIRLLGQVRDNRRHLAEADILVINAGFSAVSEAFALRKPTLVIPLEHHAEQWLNAQTLQQLGLASLATPANAHEQLLVMIDRYGEHARQCELLPLCPDGALKAAQIIRDDLR